jgi:hypothetical protein
MCGATAPGSSSVSKAGRGRDVQIMMGFTLLGFSGVQWVFFRDLMSFSGIYCDLNGIDLWSPTELSEKKN